MKTLFSLVVLFFVRYVFLWGFLRPGVVVLMLWIPVPEARMIVSLMWRACEWVGPFGW